MEEHKIGVSRFNLQSKLFFMIILIIYIYNVSAMYLLCAVNSVWSELTFEIPRAQSKIESDRIVRARCDYDSRRCPQLVRSPHAGVIRNDSTATALAYFYKKTNVFAAFVCECKMWEQIKAACEAAAPLQDPEIFL